MGKNTLGLTHGKKTFGKKNKRLRKNPKPNDMTTSYVVKRIQNSLKNKYGKTFDDWTLSSKDSMKIKHLYKSLLQRERRKIRRK